MGYTVSRILFQTTAWDISPNSIFPRGRCVTRRSCAAKTKSHNICKNKKSQTSGNLMICCLDVCAHHFCPLNNVRCMCQTVLTQVNVYPLEVTSPFRHSKSRKKGNYVKVVSLKFEAFLLKEKKVRVTQWI